MSAPDAFLLEAFASADLDGDCKLSYDELKDLLQCLGLEKDEQKLDKFVRVVDADGDGEIDFTEFQNIVDQMNTKTTSFEQHLRDMFDLYDEDGSGGIDQHELRALMAQLGVDLSDEELAAMMLEADGDGSGDVDYKEFLALFKGKVARTGEEGPKQPQEQFLHSNQQRDKLLERKDSLLHSITEKGGTIFDDAKQLMSFSNVFRFVTWLYSERKMILLASSHLVATLIIWSHFALIKFQQQEDAVPEAAPRYWAKRLVPPIEFGSMHAILFQMALIPFTMSRYTIATFSKSSLNKYLPLDKALRIHIHLGYTMVSIVFSATIVFFIFFGLSCSEGEEAFCDKFTSEIMITGYCILGLLLLMAGTAFFRHSIPYEVFYGVHFLFLAMYAIAIAHTIDGAQRSGKKDRSQTFKWFAAPLMYYLCDYAMMWFNQRFKTQVTSFTTVEGHDGSKMLILKMKRPPLFMFQPGQYAFLRAGSIDRTWHPFSIASDPESNQVEFYIEVFDEGSWTDVLWTKLKNQDKRHKMYIDLLGPYGTALVKEPSYTNIVAIGTGTGIVPCMSLLKQHVRKMVMMEPDHYFAERSVERRRNINILGALERKDGSLATHLASSLKRCVAFNQLNEDNLTDSDEGWTAESLRSHKVRQSIRSSFTALNADVLSERNKSFRHKAVAKMNVFRATKSMYGKTILALLTLYSVTIFSLNMSWNFSTADISNDVRRVLEMMTMLLHVIFFVCAFFVWNGVSLQSYFDAAISVILPFADWYYGLQSSISTPQVITLSLLNGYITFRFYQKTLALAEHTFEESVDRLRFVWSVRTVKVARQLLPEINEVYESLVKEWGEDYAKKVLDISIYITDKNRSDAASLRAQIRDLALFRSKKVVFIRPKFDKIIEEHIVEMIEESPAYSATLLAFCGGPKVSAVLAEVRSTIELLAAATGYSSHRLDFVSESYGAAKAKGQMLEDSSKEKDSSAKSLWDVVRQETIVTVTTKRVKSVFDDHEMNDKRDSLKEYKSKRELVEDYIRREGVGNGLRYRSRV